ncbi:C40 family peptidase [Salinivibrio socompensis]|uniref:C40 family peptidase n=1 Tax=Salinivibrio socompensis TaxID=1510206 RepID=UPI0004728E78|nr:C40 family peptidase [Salinivibrio socompensis]
MISETTATTILEHARAAAPAECCGLIVKKGDDHVYWPARNVAADPVSHFEIDADDWIDAENAGEVIALVHSHPNGPRHLTSLDRINQVKTGLDWLLAVDNTVLHFPPVPHLLHREFEHGVTDCYTLFRDAYALCGVEMDDFHRPDDWWKGELDLYVDNIESQDFERIDGEPQIGDVILIQLQSNKANHAAIYLGNQQILHHLPKRLSGRDLYSGYWLKHTHSVWRMKAWQPSDFTAIFDDLATNSSLT